MPLLLSILNEINGLTLVLITCELGQRLKDAFEEIANTQQSVMECFGSIAYTRDVFKNMGIK